jgi:hypothetical protein
MIKKLFPVLLAVLGIGGGIGAGLALRPDPEIVMIDPCGDTDVEMKDMHHEDDAAEEVSGDMEYVKLNNQFIIPDIDEGNVTAMIVLSLSLEAREGQREAIYAKEPKLRDAFLQILFDHANMGGFKGAFTSSAAMDTLRMALTETAQKLINHDIESVLITDILRQDI